MAKNQNTSLQDRIVNEINSTYSSIETYKHHTSKKLSSNKDIDVAAAKRRIEVVEHKLKALKMMLAKIDNGETIAFDKSKLIK